MTGKRERAARLVMAGLAAVVLLGGEARAAGTMYYLYDGAGNRIAAIDPENLSTIPGAPGGVAGNVQFRDSSGRFAGASGTAISSNGAVVLDKKESGGFAPIPGTGVVGVFAPDGVSTNAPGLPSWFDGDAAQWTGFYPFQIGHAGMGGSGILGCHIPSAYGTTTFSTWGLMTPGTPTGTASSIPWHYANAHKWPQVQYAGAATANTSAGTRSGAGLYCRQGTWGGFIWWGSFGIMGANSTANRVFVGLKNSTAALTATANPDTALHTAYFGCNTGDTVLSFCTNDGAGTATCKSLGALFPCRNLGGINPFYSVLIKANGTKVAWFINRLDWGPAYASGVATTDLPNLTSQLAWDFWINSGTSAAAATLRFLGTCGIQY
jgi:hypothetical protein